MITSRGRPRDPRPRNGGALPLSAFATALERYGVPRGIGAPLAMITTIITASTSVTSWRKISPATNSPKASNTAR